MKREIKTNLSVWRIIEHVAQTGSLTRTCIELDVDLTQASRWINQLEKELNVSLFDRKSRPLRLSEFAERHMPLIRQLILCFNQLESNAYFFQKPKRYLIKIGLPLETMSMSILSMLDLYEATHPDVTFEVLENGGVDPVLSKEVDVGYFPFSCSHPDIYCVALTQCVNSLLASPAYLEKYGVPQTVKDLSGHTLLLRKTQSYPRGLALFNEPKKFDLITGQISQKDGTTASLSPTAGKWSPPHFLFREGMAQLNSALMGKGIAVDLPLSFVERELKEKKLSVVLDGWHREIWNTSLFTHIENTSRPELMEFIRFFKERIIEMRKGKKNNS